MNREIKFRAKELNSNNWVYGYYAMRSEESPVPETNEWYCEHYILVDKGIQGFEEVMIDVKTLCQFTGLKDKNKKDVYEGDIVFNSNRTLLTTKDDKRLYLVKWQQAEYNLENTWLQKKPGFIFEKVVTDGKKYMELIFNQHQIEVVGNIFENVNLL
jgi:uncharacterized phage protein (TIGR01671 family)